MQGRRDSQSPSHCSQMDQLSSQQQCPKNKPPDVLSGDLGSASASATRRQGACQVPPLLWGADVMKSLNKRFAFPPACNILITNAEIIEETSDSLLSVPSSPHFNKSFK